jgi:hypothetical protein
MKGGPTRPHGGGGGRRGDGREGGGKEGLPQGEKLLGERRHTKALHMPHTGPSLVSLTQGGGR